MFGSISMAGTGLITVIITTILGHFGIIPAVGQINHIIGDVLAVIDDAGVVLGWWFIIWGQLRRSDLHFGLLRK